MTASVDLRGFDFALEPVRLRRSWQLDAQLLVLARMRRELVELRARRAQLDEQCRVQALEAGRAWQQRRDATSQARALHYLAFLHQSAADVDREIEVALQAERGATQECARAQARLDVLDEHHATQKAAFGQEAQRKSSAQADREWSGRRASAIEGRKS